MRRWLLATLVAVVALGAAGCGNGGPSSETAGAADLAVRVDTTDGVVRVHNEGTPPARELRLETEIGEVGGTDAASPAEFGRVASVALAADGRILVADMQAAGIRVFGPDGSFLETWGRSGEGPGEFGSPYSLGWVGDTLAVLDPGVGRIGLFDPEGRWLGQLDYPGGVSGPSSLIRLYPGGVGEVYAFRLEAVEGQLQRQFQRITAGGAEGRLPWLEGPDGPPSSVTCPRPDDAISFFDVPFAPRWIQAPAPGGRVAAAWTGEYRVRFLTADGDTARTVSRDHDPAPVTEEEWEEALADYRDFREEWPGVRCDPEMRDRPERKPPIESLHFDAAGRLWVETTGRSGLRWDVFDPEGRLVGSAPAPERAEEVAPFIGEERMVLVARDSLGVERVRVYRIERPE